MKKSPILFGVVVAFLPPVVLPSVFPAQREFIGVVKDSSGAVLPSVTVEARSRFLIEKIRSVITDERDAYGIVGLRPE